MREMPTPYAGWRPLEAPPEAFEWKASNTVLLALVDALCVVNPLGSKTCDGEHMYLSMSAKLCAKRSSPCLSRKTSRQR